MATIESAPQNATHWSKAKMAERTGLSKSTIGRVWGASGLKPHRTDGFKLSNDPLHAGKAHARLLPAHTTSLFATMNVEHGTVIASTHRRHRATEFKKFLTKIDHNVPEHLDIHVVCDNYGTHKHPTVKTWLEKHPRFHMHYTPTPTTAASRRWRKTSATG